MNKHRFLILIASVTGMLTVFLPWAKLFVNEFTKSPFSGRAVGGWFLFWIFFLPMGISLWGDRTMPLTSRIKFGNAVYGLFASIVTL